MTPTATTMEENKRVVREFYEAVFKRHDLERGRPFHARRLHPAQRGLSPRQGRVR